MTYADDRALREELYTAYCTPRLKAQNAEQHDNGPVMLEILALRQGSQAAGLCQCSELSLASG
jgi:oligopeptidase A